MLTPRDIRALSHDPEFQSISDRNSQMRFLQQFGFKSCCTELSDKAFADIYEMNLAMFERCSVSLASAPQILMPKLVAQAL
jgi:hypothetical protein